MSLKAIVQERLTDILDEQNKVEIEIPKYEHGDFALNIAFKKAKEKKTSPVKIASEMSDEINNQTSELTAIGVGGFINIKLDNAVLFDYFSSFLKKSPRLDSNESILLEYVSANPTGPLHIGHGRWAVIGDTLYRLLKTVGVKVENEFYVNNAGNQVKLFNESIEAKRHNKPMPENGYGGKFIDYVVNNNRSKSNIDFVIEYQKTTLKKIDCGFDHWFKETTLYDEDIFNKISEEFPDFIYEKDNAVWFKTTRFNDDKDRVIKKENGELTYFAADIIYHANKIDRGFTSLINIWGADHHGYIERIKASIKAKNKSIKLTIMLGQLVHLFKDGKPIKMSKRTGELIELDEVIDEIGPDATRYFLVEKKPELHLEFDLSVASSKSMENPVYYIQYAHARICNILTKVNAFQTNNKSELNDEDRKLMLFGARYYDVLYEAATHYEPYKVAQYLHEFAKCFHSFYQKNQVIENNTVHDKRLEIIEVAKNIISHASQILGISTPEKM